jgi:hypothetical protein
MIHRFRRLRFGVPGALGGRPWRGAVRLAIRYTQLKTESADIESLLSAVQDWQNSITAKALGLRVSERSVGSFPTTCTPAANVSAA